MSNRNLFALLVSLADSRSLLKKAWLILALATISLQAAGQQTVVQYLSGTDKDHTVAWDFMVNNGRQKEVWSTIPVPSCWEMQGFGTYSYYQDLPDVNETGHYRFVFRVDPEYRNKRIRIVFEGSMTDTEVMINGQPAGPAHLGGFYEFRYDITPLVKPGQSNLIEVTVRKRSANHSINRAEREADFWLFGGIFRPVYLEILPETFIDRTALSANADGDFAMQVFSNLTKDQHLEAAVYDLNRNIIGIPFSAANGDSLLHHHFQRIKLWNPEDPNLYMVVVSIKEKDRLIHSITQRFGFRTATLQPHDGFYVNGKKVIFKGVCRHSEWPETGRTLSRSVHLMDIATIKGMNMNAVRMSHYPPDKEFLDLCDSLGLFVLDELTGWQKAYDTSTAKRLVKELVIRDVNHPSIVIWDNGNEGGWNRSADNDFDLYDPQKRHVIHPWERFNQTNTKHYPNFQYLQNEMQHPSEVFFPTEFMHGLFDGGHGAGLEDFWNEMAKHPYNAGGFLWSLHDEGVVRGDRHDSIDVAGNLAPDGIVGPHREREESYYTIKELWSPVYIETKNIANPFKGKIELENHYLYTNLDQITFAWKFVAFPAARDKITQVKTIRSGVLKGPSIAPGSKGILALPSLTGIDAQACYLTALDGKNDTICTWSWAIASPKTIVKPMLTLPERHAVNTKTDDATLAVNCDNIRYFFDRSTGFLQKVLHGNKEISFSGGPALAGSKLVLDTLKNFTQDTIAIVEPLYQGDSLKVKWIFEPGRLPKLEYSYVTSDTTDYMGITFNYPEQKIKAIKYLGRGPYRVWKNRLKGQQLGVWQKNYNNTVTGENWNYPEFKGYFSQLYWMKLINSENDFTIYTDQPSIYLQLLKPQKPAAATNDNTSPPFPDGDIGFMHAIPAIGTKFNPPAEMGPQSRKNTRDGRVPLKGVLYFDFR